MLTRSKITVLFFTAFILQSGIVMQVHAGKTSSVEQQDPEEAKREGIELLVRTLPRDVLGEICEYMRGPGYKTVRSNDSSLNVGVQYVLPLHDGRLASLQRSYLQILNPKINTKYPYGNNNRNELRCAAELPDGKLVVSDVWSGEHHKKDSKLWLVREKFANESLEASALNYHDGKIVRCIAVFPDGRVAIGLSDGVITHESGDRHYRQRSITLLNSGVIKIWDSKTAGAATTLNNRNAEIASLLPLPGGRLAAGGVFLAGRGGARGIVTIWDPNTPKVLTEFLDHKSCVAHLCLLNDGRVVSGSEDEVYVWNLDNPKIKEIISNKQVVAELIVPVILQSEQPALEQKVCTWSSSNFNIIKAFFESGGTTIARYGMRGIVGLGILPDGRLVSAIGNYLAIWNQDNFEMPEVVLQLPDQIFCIALLKNGSIAVGLAHNGVLIVGLTDSSELEEALKKQYRSIPALPDVDAKHSLTTANSAGGGLPVGSARTTTKLSTAAAAYAAAGNLVVHGKFAEVAGNSFASATIDSKSAIAGSAVGAAGSAANSAVCAAAAASVVNASTSSGAGASAHAASVAAAVVDDGPPGHGSGTGAGANARAATAADVAADDDAIADFDKRQYEFKQRRENLASKEQELGAVKKELALLINQKNEAESVVQSLFQNLKTLKDQYDAKRRLLETDEGKLNREVIIADGKKLSEQYGVLQKELKVARADYQRKAKVFTECDNSRQNIEKMLKALGLAMWHDLVRDVQQIFSINSGAGASAPMAPAAVVAATGSAVVDGPPGHGSGPGAKVRAATAADYAHNQSNQ